MIFKKTEVGDSSSTSAQKTAGKIFPRKNTPTIICTARITGIPITKYQCLVLWRNKYMPSHAPRLPPRIPTPKSAFSEIRHLCRTAFDLSIPIIASPSRLIPIRYTIITSSIIPIPLPQLYRLLPITKQSGQVHIKKELSYDMKKPRRNLRDFAFFYTDCLRFFLFKLHLKYIPDCSRNTDRRIRTADNSDHQWKRKLFNGSYS